MQTGGAGYRGATRVLVMSSTAFTLMFAVWLMSVSMGTALSGVLGSLYNPNDAAAERTFFLTLSAATIVLGLVLIAISRWVVRKFGDVR